MDSIQKLTELFKQFPGIGPRQAKRFVYFLLGQKNGYSAELSRLISELKNEIACCEMCFRFFPKDKADASGRLPDLQQGGLERRGSLTCPICRDQKRDKTKLMIVSRDVDFENIEKTHSFNGYYFVLGGLLPILEKEPQEKIRQKELMDILTKRVKSGLKEIILALDYNPEGENTRDHLTGLLGPFGIKLGFTLSSLGRGLSTGSELEYSDPDTIKNALNNRK